MKLGAVLMASGAGRRFGGNKLLHPVDGVPMILRAFAAVPAELFVRACVVSCYPEILTMAGERGYLPVPNPDADQGQSASVRLGLAELLEMDGVLFCVCDQPWLRRGSGVPRRCFPVICSRSCWPSPGTGAGAASSGPTGTACGWWRHPGLRSFRM